MRDASPWFLLTLCVLAVWRLSHLAAHEDGPFDAVLWLRARAGAGMLGRLMDCPYCLSLWIAAPAALLLARQVAEWCVTWLAISGGACLLEKLAARAATTKLPLDGADDHAVLRTTTRRDDDADTTPTLDG